MAQPSVTPSTNELDERQKLAQALNETMLSTMAQEDQRLAAARTEESNIEMGTIDGKPKESNYVVPEGASVLGTFGRSKLVKKGGLDIVETAAPPPPGYQVDVGKVAQAEATKQPTFDIDQEMSNLRSMVNPNEKDVAAQNLFINVGQQISVIQQKVRSNAAQRSGANDAQAALEKWSAIEAGAIQSGKLRMGDHYIQTDQARETLQKALQTANQLEADLLKTDPEMQKYTDYRNLLVREMGQINREQDKKEQRDAVNENNFGALTPARLTNAKLALGLTETDSNKLRTPVYNELKRDKALRAILDAGKEDYPAFLASNDMQVRKYAYNIIAGKEAALNGGVVPDYIKRLEPLVSDRQALLTPDEKKALTKPSMAIGQKAKDEEQFQAIHRNIAGFIEQVGRNKYQDMNKWVFTNDSMKTVVLGLKAQAKDGKVLRSDGIDAIMKADIFNPDKTLMTPQDKINTLVQSIGLTMDNDKGSTVLPDTQIYGPLYASETRSEAMRSFVRSKLPINPTPFSTNTIAGAVMQTAEMAQAAGETAKEYANRLINHGKKILGVN